MGLPEVRSGWSRLFLWLMVALLLTLALGVFLLAVGLGGDPLRGIATRTL